MPLYELLLGSVRETSFNSPMSGLNDNKSELELEHTLFLTTLLSLLSLSLFF